MKVYPDQLTNYLQKQKEMPRAFLIAGDEPLQKMEATDSIRQAAKKMGYSERDVFQVDAQFNWSTLAGASNSLSLFSERKILDINVLLKSPGKSGSQAIRDYMTNPPNDKILLLQTDKLAGGAVNSAWVKAIDKVGVVTQVWTLSTPQTMAWIAKRMREQGLQPTAEAVRLLTERVEGNLLAATQEISKLKLLYLSHSEDSHFKDNFTIDNKAEAKNIQGTNNPIIIDEEKVLAAVSDSSRFSIFDLSNAVMLGDQRRVQHIHHNLREEGVPIQLILWTLSDLSRQLYNASFSLRNGSSISQILNKMPRPRQKPFQIAIQRMQSADWSEILQKNGQIDRLSKGQGDIANKGLGRVWSDLLELALILTNSPAIKENSISF